ncbi:helix-turn-helix domain-containing protein [Bordetella bronchialis]|uniref:helix-turn-helix domain-containing protein n=1 Tax=Bordetella bronchialis TaxID=463025 RepID=UPI001E530AC0|nr:helix-turn-helix transcriptional regulator [Bordetella bronchialis]
MLPYAEYLELTQKDRPVNPRIPADGTIPHEVVQLSFKNDCSLIRAWREYLGITQNEMAQRVGIRQPSYLAMEATGAKPKKATKQRIADAMGILYDQIDGQVMVAGAGLEPATSGL